jgi:hypothetical protein
MVKFTILYYSNIGVFDVKQKNKKILFSVKSKYPVFVNTIYAFFLQRKQFAWFAW